MLLALRLLSRSQIHRVPLLRALRRKLMLSLGRRDVLLLACLRRLLPLLLRLTHHVHLPLRSALLGLLSTLRVLLLLLELHLRLLLRSELLLVLLDMLLEYLLDLRRLLILVLGFLLVLMPVDVRLIIV